MFTVISLNGNGENNQEELRRRKYLIFRGSVFCLGLSKFIGATLCCILYLLTLSVKPRPHTEHLVPTLQVGLLVATGPLIVYGTLLIISTLRAMTLHQFTLLLAILFAIVLGIYDFLLGFLGAYTYFSSMAYTKPFLMVVAFTCQATNIICSFIYDLPLLIAFRRIRRQDIQNRAYN